MKQSLKRRVLFTTLLVVLFCAGALIAYVLETSFLKLKQQTINTMKEISTETALKIKAKIDEEFALIHSFAQLPNITNTDYTEEEKAAHKDVVEKCAFFIPFYSKYPKKYENIAFYDKDGYFALPNGTVLQLPNKPYIVQPCKTGKDYVDDPRFSTVNDQVIMFLSTVVRDKKNKPIGCMVNVLRGNIMDNIVNEIEIDKGYYPIIVNTKTNEIITSTEKIPQDKKEEYTNLITSIGKELNEYIDPITGIKMTALSVPIEGYNWKVVYSVPYNKHFGMYIFIRIKVYIFSLLSLFTLGFVLWIIFSKSFKPLKNLEASMLEISSGNADLTKRIENTTKHEIGVVINCFNTFINKLQEIICEVKKTKDKIFDKVNVLKEISNSTVLSTKQILTSIENVDNQVNNASNVVSTTATAVEQISANIKSFEKMVEREALSIETASAAIEQMLGNIQSVTHSMDILSNSFEDLFNKVKNGTESQTSVNLKIDNIKEQSKSLEEANKVIANIASQTNLLAMNAAIEAAHAGEFGKGFAVVADEIRKLAEVSSAQSKVIKNNLKTVTNAISEAALESYNTNQAFVTVTETIQNVNNLIMETKQAMNEQNDGSKQISISLVEIKNGSAEVESSMFEMSKGNQSILTEVQKLQDVAIEIENNVKSITTDIRNIDNENSNLNEVANNISNSVDTIGKEIDKFNC